MQRQFIDDEYLFLDDVVPDTSPLDLIDFYTLAFNKPYLIDVRYDREPKHLMPEMSTKTMFNVEQ